MEPAAMLARLERAANDHDIEALAGCFAEDYVNETPVHPARGFRGRDQVRANWRQIFAGVPDLRARVVAAATDGPTVWSEWDMSGTRRDGAAHHLRGVVVFQVHEGLATAARFYLEPVDLADTDVDAAVRLAVGSGSGSGS